MTPKEALRYHVTGAIERGEAVAIEGDPKNGLTLEEILRLETQNIDSRRADIRAALGGGWILLWNGYQTGPGPFNHKLGCREHVFESREEKSY